MLEEEGKEVEVPQIWEVERVDGKGEEEGELVSFELLFLFEGG